MANLLQALRSAMDKVPDLLCILLDGLDEYDGQKVELTNFINSLCSDKTKIRLANRADPPFPDAFAGVPCSRHTDLTGLASS